VADRKEPYLDTVGALLNGSCFRCDLIDRPVKGGMRPAFVVHEPGSHYFLLSSSFMRDHGAVTA